MRCNMNMSKSFAIASYNGIFRDYQRHLLKKLEDRLDEKKLNIVTPPGSGKIVLGLELVRRIGEPCLIVSSTEVMCTHWADHFMSCFLPEEEQTHRDQYLSHELMEPSLITSITYEALRVAVKQSAISSGEKTTDTSADVIRLMQDRGIHTILLDDPHHLDSRQTDALGSFLGILGGEFRLLILTSTPPYDLSNEDMERYLSLCGEISEEIHIPELVKGGALCPHQDYVYFNYPTESEARGIRGYRTRVEQAVTEAVALPFMGELGRRLSKLFTRKKTDFLYNHHEAVVGALEMLYEYGHRININEYTHLTGSKTVAPLTLEAAQHAINLLLESQTLLRDSEKDQLMELFNRHHVIDRGRVHLTLTPKVRRTLMASAGKLDSIVAITEAEDTNQNGSMRMVILTDSMSEGDAERLASDTPAYDLSLVSIFGALSSKLSHVPAGCLTDFGTLLPASAAAVLTDSYGAGNVSVAPTGTEGYVLCSFADSEQKNDLTARLFREGHIRVLIGSADTLGIGWDDSFVNTLIDAAPYGSFVESHRMRGRVIHADKLTPAKTAHVWHLVTIEHPYTAGENNEFRLASRLTTMADGGLASDYRHLRRRFECYIGPNVKTGELENGIDRLGIKDLPHSGSMDNVNSATLQKSNDRAQLTAVWMTAMEDSTKPISEVRVPKTAKVPVFTAKNILLALATLVGLIGGIYSISFLIKALIIYIFFNNGLVVSAAVVVVLLMLFMAIAITVISLLYILYFLPLPISHITASLSIRSLCRNLLKALKDIGEVNKDAVMVMENLPDKKGYRLYLDNCSHDEQITFQKAVAEMLSPLHSARYILVRGGWFRRLLWKWSFTCPTVIARNDVSVKVFEKYIRRSMGSMKFQYTRRDPGRKYLIFARNKSYLNVRGTLCEKRIHLLKNERVL